MAAQSSSSPMPTQMEDIELQSRKTTTVQEKPIVNNEVTEEATPLSRDAILKLLASGLSFFFAGTNDGSLGALIPYMLRTYGIGTGFVAIIYAASFVGWLVAAATNSHILKLMGTGSILAIGAALQLLAHSLRPWGPVYGLFVATFFFQSLGMAYQDSHCNTYVSTVKGAHRWLGFIHAMYALGCLVSPFVATAIASHVPESRWFLFYLFLLGLGVINQLFVMYAFRDSLTVHWKRETTEEEHQTMSSGRNKDAVRDISETFKLPGIWWLSLFYFCYLGVSLTGGGWIVEFLVQVRHGQLADMGYVPTALSGGVFLGRLLLAEPTARFGERNMVLLYIIMMLAMQLIFWLVPNITSGIVAITIFGFCGGPLFATGISVGSKLFPRRLQPTALSLVFVLAQAGGCFFPAVTGVLASRVGIKIMQPMSVGLLGATAIAWMLVPKINRHKD